MGFKATVSLARMRKNILALWELRSKLLSECSQPSFGLAISSVDGVEVLVIDIHAYKVLQTAGPGHQIPCNHVPSRSYSFTQAAMVFAVAVGSAPLEVGTSVDPAVFRNQKEVIFKRAPILTKDRYD